MKTTLLHQFYQMLGLEKLPSSKEEAEQYIADKLQRSVWNQHQAEMVHKAFKYVRLTLKLYKYIQMHPNNALKESEGLSAHQGKRVAPQREACYNVNWQKNSKEAKAAAET